MKRSRAKHFTQEQIELLRSNLCVKHVTDNKVLWTLIYRQEMYDRWLINPNVSTIRAVMEEHGIDPHILGSRLISDIGRNFRRYGRPSQGAHNKLYAKGDFHSNREDNKWLISTGNFIARGKGISFSDEFTKELYSKYPEQSIEEGLRAVGIDPEVVGCQRIDRLKCQFDGKEPVHHRKRIYSDEEIQKYKDHPYVRKITSKQLVLTDSFYNEAYVIADLPLEEILNAFEIEPSILNFSSFMNMQIKLKRWVATDAEVNVCNDQIIRIHWNILKLMEEKTEADLMELKEQIPSFSKHLKKKMFEQIHRLPNDPEGVYTIRRILRKIGVSKSCYYTALKNDNYGLYEQNKDLQDEEDREVIQVVINYKGHPKGKRMIYMMMKKITGKQFGLNKIMRLNRKFGMQCQVRKANTSRQAARELMERNKKPNLLRRTFRMHHPDEVILTDVTYIPYGNKRVYGSACKDPVTGILKAFNGSANNDMNLVEVSLKEIQKYPLAEHPLFHSDQGALYLTDTWQKELSDLGFTQSMSKRGNCWDNASQESFFGHFKDEVDFSDCHCDEDIFRKMAEYQDYYNNERPQWTRNKMTPVEYGEYLKNMSEEEYQAYLQKETEKYNKMKEKAAEKAVKRAKTLGV